MQPGLGREGGGRNLPVFPMKIAAALLLLIVLALLTGCVTHQIIIPAGPGVALRQYKTAKLVVTDSVNTHYSTEGAAIFEELLKGQLESLGYTLPQEGGDLNVEIKITDFEPGNRAARTLIGGVGRAILTYTVRFLDRSGSILAEMKGGKTFNG